MKSTTERSLKYLRAQGWCCFVAERWNAFAKIRQDAFGFGDLLCFVSFGAYKGIWLVQVTSGSNHVKRKTKLLGIPASKGWLESSGRIAVLSWSKKGPRGKPKRWTPRFEEIKDAEPEASRSKDDGLLQF